MDEKKFVEALFELIRLTATELPDDVTTALAACRRREAPGSNAEFILAAFLRNIEMAKERGVPLCQDTGAPTFYISHSGHVSRRWLKRRCEEALAEATGRQYLRPNAVDSVTGHNSGNNVGQGFPPLYFTEWDDPAVGVSLMLKGGGSENVGSQYSLPCDELNAGRDLEGVRIVALDALRRAEGKGCPPGVLGICIGGDRGSGYAESKRQLLRRLDDVNPDATLAKLEDRLFEEGNRLGIGPLGLGGESTLMGVKIGALYRLPACYFVTITYMCWEHRRRSIRIEQDGTYRLTG
jgi:fumarate hydratase, class I